MLKFICSFFIFSTCFNAVSQSQDTVQRVIELPFTDTRLFNGIRFGVDVAGIAYGYMVNDDNFTIRNKYELNGDFGIKRFFAILDLGRGSFERISSPDNGFPTNSKYESSGSYFRIGGDYRVSKSAKSFLFAGMRLGKSFINEKLQYQTPLEFAIANNKIEYPHSETRSLSVNWFEMNTGVKAHIWQNFYLGYTLRFKFLLAGKKVKEEEPLDVPGYGVANKNNNLGMSFHIMYRIPFGKDPVIRQ